MFCEITDMDNGANAFEPIITYIDFTEAVTIHVSWSYKKDENWYVYPDNVNVKIEKAFQRNSQLCIVEVHGEM